MRGHTLPSSSNRCRARLDQVCAANHSHRCRDFTAASVVLGAMPLPSALGVALLTAVVAAAAGASATKPNIVMLVVDDWGHYDWSHHRPAGDREISTPNLDALVQEGLELTNGELVATERGIIGGRIGARQTQAPSPQPDLPAAPPRALTATDTADTLRGYCYVLPCVVCGPLALLRRQPTATTGARRAAAH